MMCLLPNACDDEDLCCAFCKKKRCSNRCTDDYTKCRYFDPSEYIADKEKPQQGGGNLFAKKKRRQKLKVYLAGKITGDPDYKKKFAAAEEFYTGGGCIVLNPATLPEGMTGAGYMRICFAMIDCADLVVFLRDYEESDGARLESAYCDYVGKTQAIDRRF